MPQKMKVSLQLRWDWGELQTKIYDELRESKSCKSCVERYVELLLSFQLLKRGQNAPRFPYQWKSPPFFIDQNISENFNKMKNTDEIIELELEELMSDNERTDDPTITASPLESKPNPMENPNSSCFSRF